jgi:tetraacyldisaccharide-1-P 4'-kinase
MTEKDAVKCERWAAANHWYVPVQAVVSENLESAIVDLLTDRLAAVGGRQLPSNRAL